jgi:hypothetical protein
VHVDGTADGNKSGSKEKSFQVIAKGLTPGDPEPTLIQVEFF